MSGLTPIQKAANMNEIISESGTALCALAEILDAVDEDRFKGDYPHAHLGYLLKIIGVETLQNTSHVRELLEAAHAASANANAPLIG